MYKAKRLRLKVKRVNYAPLVHKQIQSKNVFKSIPKQPFSLSVTGYNFPIYDSNCRIKSVWNQVISFVQDYPHKIWKFANFLNKNNGNHYRENDITFCLCIYARDSRQLLTADKRITEVTEMFHNSIWRSMRLLSVIWFGGHHTWIDHLSGGTWWNQG